MISLALRIILTSTTTSIDHFIELIVRLEECIAMLPYMSLNYSKCSGMVGINSLGWWK
jgi:hypothetical protein